MLNHRSRRAHLGNPALRNQRVAHEAVPRRGSTFGRGFRGGAEGDRGCGGETVKAEEDVHFAGAYLLRQSSVLTGNDRSRQRLASESRQPDCVGCGDVGHGIWYFYGVRGLLSTRLFVP